MTGKIENKKLLPPCLACELRSPGCHGGCKAYMAWKRKIKAIGEKQKSPEAESYLKERAVAGRQKRSRTWK